MLMPPCYNCQDREIGCHAVCEKYKEYYQKNEERKKTKAQRLAVDNYFVWKEHEKANKNAIQRKKGVFKK